LNARRVRASVAALALCLAACASPPPSEPADEPTQDILEVVAVLRLHVADDTYRFAPARDLSGRNVFRASFERLESLETAHAEKLSTGYLTDVLWFSKARALERIGEYELARMHYARVAQLDSELAEAASQGRGVCERLVRATAPESAAGLTPQRVADRWTERRAQLVELRKDVLETHWRPVVDEEIERGDAAEAAYFAAQSESDPSLEATALQRAQQLVELHRESKNKNRHLLALADLYAELSRRYARRNPPPSLGFDPATVDEYAHGATRVYEVVAQQDGTVEKLEAAHKLEAYLGYMLQVHEEKLPH
jgi:tetratricopeptide (TPR) repeat protein